MPHYQLEKRAVVIALRALGLTGAGMLSLGAASPAIGQSITWNGTQSNDWLDPLNWSTATLPGPTGNLFISSLTPNAAVIDNNAALAGVIFLGAIGGP